ncbi:hypothetical protein DSM104299_04248 [Baekduia alba]|uniref:hypothetical protein n=1 Tax=Baekduia alba TaxID=2997333 RepID=UPI00233FA97A|nr:hypothetical protein [Baekduia alba]WCB95500.1 hypothetical protein DSM104299_04248 [Baekduia alba]
MPDRRAVVLSATAKRRYAERVRPDLSFEEAAEDLRRRARRGRMWRRRPTWLKSLERPDNGAGFLLLADEPQAVLPLVRNESGDVVATTAKPRRPRPDLNGLRCPEPEASALVRGAVAGRPASGALADDRSGDT